MEQISSWKSHKNWVVFLLSLVLLIGLFSAVELVNPEIHFPDPALEQVIREKIERPAGPIYRADVQTITEIHAAGRGIHSLEGMGYLQRLAYLDLENNHIEDLAPLSSLRMLAELNLRNNQVIDMRPLTGHRRLVELDLRGNQIVELASLCRSRDLTYLNLRDNQVEDISQLDCNSSLVYLNIHSNPISSGVEQLAYLTNLETLIMRNVHIGDDAEFLRNLIILNRLNIRNTQFSNVQVLVDLMEKGAFKKIIRDGANTHINILENNLPYDANMLNQLRPYWYYIDEKYPLVIFDSNLVPPKVSHESGWYNTPIFLEFSQSYGHNIYYTLDGTEPDTDSIKYETPILITDNCDNKNGNMYPSILRARIIDEKSYDVSPIISLTYFVGECFPDRFTLPIISLITDPSYLFNQEIGIFTEDNYQERGKKWERPMHLEVINTNGQSEFDQTINARVHGTYARKWPQKSIRIDAENNYGFQDLLEYQFFPEDTSYSSKDVEEYASLILRNSSYDWDKAMMRDIVIQSLYSDIMIYKQAFRTFVVFINGEYWGLYHLRERIDHYFIMNRYNSDKEEIRFVEYDFHEGLIGDSEAIKDYLKIYQFIENHDLSDNENYKEITKIIDIDNFIDINILYMYSSNYDWPNNNNKFYKLTNEASDKGLSDGDDGLWKWIINDFDRGFDLRFLNKNMLEHATNIDEKATPLFKALLENENFRNRFINRFADHLNSTFRPEKVIKNIDIIKEILAPEMSHQINRWNNLIGYQDWHEHVNELRDFSLERPSIQREHIVEFFDLDGTYNLTINCDPDMSVIIINSVNISKYGLDGICNWSGIYFVGVPVDIFIYPNEGYSFEGWEVFENQMKSIYTSASITINGETDLVIRPILKSDLSKVYD